MRERCAGGGGDKGRSAITGARAVRWWRRGQGQERDNGCAGGAQGRCAADKGARVEARTRAGARKRVRGRCAVEARTRAGALSWVGFSGSRLDLVLFVGFACWGLVLGGGVVLRSLSVCSGVVVVVSGLLVGLLFGVGVEFGASCNITRGPGFFSHTWFFPGLVWC